MIKADDNSVRQRIAELLNVGAGSVVVQAIATGEDGDKVTLYLWAVQGAGHPIHGYIDSNGRIFRIVSPREVRRVGKLKAENE